VVEKLLEVDVSDTIGQTEAMGFDRTAFASMGCGGCGSPLAAPAIKDVASEWWHLACWSQSAARAEQLRSA
jgi:hypothetical protein